MAIRYDPLNRQNFIAKWERLHNSVNGKSGWVDTSEPRGEQADKAERMSREYYKTVPILPLSRCPFCEQVNTFALDTIGLDGLWWTFPGIRPKLHKYNLCPHFINLLGAVKVHYPVRNSSLQVQPGPEVPFVVPELIKHESVKAVVSQIPVGENIAYPIFYYGEVRPLLKCEFSSGADAPLCIVRFPDTPDQERLKMPPLWGSDYYRWRDKHRKNKISEGFLFDRQCDFEIAPWIEEGKLLWITPEDDTLTLHNTLDDCPYLEMPGIRHFQRIEDGSVQYSHNYQFFDTEDGKTWIAED